MLNNFMHGKFAHFILQEFQGTFKGRVSKYWKNVMTLHQMWYFRTADTCTVQTRVPLTMQFWCNITICSEIEANHTKKPYLFFNKIIQSSKGLGTQHDVCQMNKTYEMENFSTIQVVIHPVVCNLW